MGHFCCLIFRKLIFSVQLDRDRRQSETEDSQQGRFFGAFNFVKNSLYRFVPNLFRDISTDESDFFDDQLNNLGILGRDENREHSFEGVLRNIFRDVFGKD